MGTEPRTTRHPIQPLEWDDATPPVLRYKKNHIVRDLYEFAKERGMGMNEISASNKYNEDDHRQFFQLIGYSHGGGTMIDDDTYAVAQRMFENGQTEEQARIAHLEAMVSEMKQGLAGPMASLFGVHEDDLLNPRG